MTNLSVNSEMLRLCAVLNYRITKFERNFDGAAINATQSCAYASLSKAPEFLILSIFRITVETAINAELDNI